MKKERCKNPVCGSNGNCDTCRWKKSVIENSSDSYEIVSGYSHIENSEAVGDVRCIEKKAYKSDGQDYYLAVDLGTTTLVFQLIEKESKKCVHTVTSLNSQHKYGADVISRIQAATQHKAEELRACIIKDLRAGIEKITEETSICVMQIEKMVLAGNATMIHLLMGYDTSGLGRYPFTPVNLDMICESMSTVLQMENVTAQDIKDSLITIFPGISAFVGGDIVSGLYALSFDKNSEINLLIDLGTNGEIALGNKDRILVASTAAGPAFECGSVGWGSEMIETAALLLENGIMDETGLLEDKYFENGYPITYTEEGEQIYFTQKDIRSLQLAKAAIRAGVEILLLHYGITVDEVSNVYLAGGFGYYLDIQKAATVGLLSKELALKSKAVGNTSLAGAGRFLYDKEGTMAIEDIREVSEDVVLSNDDLFNEFYMKFMLFE